MRKALLALIQRAHFSHGESYDRHTARLFGGLHRNVVEEVAAAAPTGGVVLDAGCGSGRLAVLIARRRPDLQVRGVDLEQGMVEVAARRAEQEGLASRVQFTAADLADLQLPDDSVDLIVSTASMHHWADVGAVIASLGRVLRPGGQLWIYDFRIVPAGRVRSAARNLDCHVDRTLIRTGSFPAALFQRLAVQPMSSSHPQTPAHPTGTH
ncbi:MAG TPA: class I SAM-dependent methyltransferase [Streptosporangiaceae bacterium]|nr:class I SAM-dependent methyltransferase [Streptosporangiaceae bacterium]